MIYYSNEIITHIGFAPDLRRETIYLDARDQTEFIPTFEDLDLHKFWVFLKEKEIVECEIVDLSKQYVNDSSGWHGITSERLKELESKPPIIQSIAYLVKVLNSEKLLQLSNSLGYGNSAPVNPYAHLSHRALSVKRDKEVWCFDKKILFNSNQNQTLLSLLRQALGETDFVTFKDIALDVHSKIKLNSKLSASSLQEKISRSFDDTIIPKIEEILKTVEHTRFFNPSNNPKIISAKDGIRIINPKKK